MERNLEVTLRITDECYDVDFYDCDSGDSIQYSMLKTENWDDNMARSISNEILSWFKVMEDEMEETEE